MLSGEDLIFWKSLIHVIYIASDCFFLLFHMIVNNFRLLYPQIFLLYAASCTRGLFTWNVFIREGNFLCIACIPDILHLVGSKLMVLPVKQENQIYLEPDLVGSKLNGSTHAII